MKLKYYMRGLGVGIIITTIILSLANKNKVLSNEEIISRAEELGMVMKDKETNDKLKEVIENSLDKDDNTEEVADDTIDDKIITDDEVTIDEEIIVDEEDLNGENLTNEDIDDENISDDTGNHQITEEDTVNQETNDDNKTQEPDLAEEDTITFTITKGMTSGQVAELIKQSGLIEDAIDFDDYIRQNGKSTVIDYGSYVLPRDASYKEILDAIVAQ